MIKEECGLFGYIGDPITDMQLIVESLVKLQHRGQDSFGFTTTNIDSYKYIKTPETNKKQLLSDLSSIDKFNGIIGHLRYKTSGNISQTDVFQHVQPLENKTKEFYLAHNGNISNTEILRQTLRQLNPKLDISYLEEMDHDTHYILAIIDNLPGTSLEHKLISFMKLVPGVYCLLILHQDNLYVLRDRYGVRPLSIATYQETNYLVASESVAFFPNSHYLRDVNPGEIIKINKINGLTTIYQHPSKPKHCLFEYIYFLRPETKVNQITTKDIRHQYGKLLALKEKNIGEILEYPYLDETHNICIIKPINPNAKYIVVGSPSSGILSAQQYARETKLEYKQIILKQKNIRSFILNNDAERRQACYQKFKFLEEDIRGNNIILADDSLVRGNTTRIMVQVLKELGAIEVHVRIASPPIKHPCYFGIDMPTSKELMASQHPLYSVTRIIGADSLIYLDLEDIKTIHQDNVCHACFSGEYIDELLNW